MKAVLFHHHGDSQVLEFSDFPTPEPGHGEILVRLKAAALNRVDIWVRQGWPGLKLEYPHIPGADGAGEVVAMGESAGSISRPGESRSWSLGDRVVINSNLSCGGCEFCLAGFDNRCRSWELLGETRRGTYAEYVAVPARNLLPLPERFDDRSAAAAALVFHTAWHSLITRGDLRAGENVLIVGASGGVNTACIQVAKLAGANVLVVGSNTEKLAFAGSLGADHLIDRSRDQDWSKTVYLLTGKRGADVVVDNVGSTFPASFRAAARGGRILTVGNTGGANIEIDNRYIFRKHLALIGSTMGTRNDFKTVMELVFAGLLKPVLDRDYPLADAAAAQDRLERDEQFGKITLAID
jgi:NADPH:quinone reductase-like Zn-dependent oxidoreductase